MTNTPITEKVEAVKRRMLKWADEDVHEVGRDVLRRQAQQFARDFESACRREVDELTCKLMTLKSEQKTAANVIIDQTNKVDKLEREVEELSECLKEARRDLCKACRSIGFKCKKSEPCMTVLNIDIALHKAL